MLILAHAGHWALWIVYALPAVIVIVAVIAALRSPGPDQLEEQEEAGEQDPGAHAASDREWPAGTTGSDD